MPIIPVSIAVLFPFTNLIMYSIYVFFAVNLCFHFIRLLSYRSPSEWSNEPGFRFKVGSFRRRNASTQVADI